MLVPWARSIALPALYPGEKYAGGIITPDGKVRHTILLPGALKVLNWNAGTAWAEERGGSLPDRIEQSLLRLHLPNEFDLTEYWCCEQTADDPDWAWFEDFFGGGQFYDAKASRLACRAVRRETIST